MKLTVVQLLSYVTVSLALEQGKVDYADQKVLKCKLNDLSDIRKFSKYDVWNQDSKANTVTVRVRGSKQTNDLTDRFSCEIVISDLNARLNAIQAANVNQNSRLAVGGVVSDEEFFKNYQSYDIMINTLKRWSRQYNRVATFIPSIGKTIEKRDLFAFKIASRNYYKPKKSIWFNGGLHAREWISPSAVFYAINKFLVNSNKEPVKGLLDNFDFYFTPLANPDGYEFSRTSDRLWRKNRRLNPDNTTYGVDLNRNWDEHWGVVGASTDPNEEDYMGTAPRSEPEVRALANFALSLPRAYGGIDFHSYGQQILRNWGWTTTNSTNEKTMLRLSQKMFDAQKRNNFTYNVDTSAGLYPAAGTLDDWMASKAKMVSFTVELCPIDDELNFELPPKDILACVQSNYDMVLAYSKFLVENPNIPPNRLVN